MQQNAGGSGVALRVHIPLHTISQEVRFWAPAMGVFKVHNATNAGGSGAHVTAAPVVRQNSAVLKWLHKFGCARIVVT